MFFRVEGIQPMWGEELRAALQGVRDQWARVTLQDDQDPAYLASEEAVVAARAYAGNPLGGMGAGEMPIDAPQKLREAVERQRLLIERQNHVPGAVMLGALELINQGIEHAVAISFHYGGPVRVTIVGQFNTMPNMLNGGYKRLSVGVDDASLG
jgi:hypothetical protein